MLIAALNPTTDDLERSYLTSSIAEGVTSFTVRNNDRFTVGQKLMLGQMGRERTEIVTVDTVNADGQTVTITSATIHPHEADDPVFELRFDQVKFYRSTTGVDGSYSVIATETLDVDNEDLTTYYDDTTGLSTYYYKSELYNSVSTAASTQSDPVAGSGYDRKTVGFLTDEILNEVDDMGEQFVTRKEILAFFNECSDDLRKASKRPWAFLLTRVALNRVASQNYINFSDIDDNLLKIDRIDYVYDDGSAVDETYPLRYVSPEKFRRLTEDNDAAESNQLKYYTVDESVDRVRLSPTPDTAYTGAYYIHFWKDFTRLDSDGDVFQTWDVRPYKLYALAKIFRKRSYKEPSNIQIADRYFADYNIEKVNMLKLNRREAGSPRSFEYDPQTVRGLRRY